VKKLFIGLPFLLRTMLRSIIVLISTFCASTDYCIICARNNFRENEDNFLGNVQEILSFFFRQKSLKSLYLCAFARLDKPEDISVRKGVRLRALAGVFQPYSSINYKLIQS